MQSRYLEYIIKLLTDDKERKAFKRNPDAAMANAHLSPEEQFSLKSLALADLTPGQLGDAVLRALEYSTRHSGGPTGFGPP